MFPQTATNFLFKNFFLRTNFSTWILSANKYHCRKYFHKLQTTFYSKIFFCAQTFQLEFYLQMYTTVENVFTHPKYSSKTFFCAKTFQHELFLQINIYQCRKCFHKLQKTILFKNSFLHKLLFLKTIQLLLSRNKCSLQNFISLSKLFYLLIFCK